MRLWHKDLIPVLPRQQLLSQWRECCAIAQNISIKGTPHHLLVNKVLKYPMEHFITYSRIVMEEMRLRGYRCNGDAFDKHGLKPSPNFKGMDHDELFFGWHEDRYLQQCFYNLQEKYDCGGIPEDEWGRIELLYYIGEIYNEPNN